MSRPDQWVLMHYKDQNVLTVFASWSGGYLTGDSWKRSSELDYAVKTSDDEVCFVTKSGSRYQVNWNNLGISNVYNAGVLNELARNASVELLQDKDSVIRTVVEVIGFGIPL